jgi:3-hydroxyisobutyrate dehydrogenase-like beta-hydroxyacid dehydrogenase
VADLTGLTVGLLHPGRMGSAIAAQLIARGHRVVWCPVGRSAGSARRAEQAGLVAVDSIGELLTACDVVFSICPPAAAEEVADQIAGYTGIFVEANAISPHRMVAIGERLDATVVDASIIGPPPSATARARMYLSGPADAVELVRGLLAGSTAEPVSLGARLGQASALKMAFGSFQKTSRALAAVSHAIAGDYGVTEQLLKEATELGDNALMEPDYLPSAAARAWRWAPEMIEVAETARMLGLPDALATGSAEVMARWAADQDDFDIDLATALRHLHED